MARILSAVDDYANYQAKQAGKPAPNHQATLSVEVSVIVRDLEGNVLSDRSLAPVRLDMNAANTDELKQKVQPFWRAGEPVSSGSSSPRSTTRRSGTSRPRSASSSSTGGGTTSQKRAYNTAVRAWASTREEFSDVSPQGRIPNHVTNAFEEAIAAGTIKNDEWIEAHQKYHNGAPAAPSSPSTGAHAAPEPDENAPASASNVNPAPQDLSDDDGDDEDDADPPMDQTKDEDWNRGPRPNQFSGV